MRLMLILCLLFASLAMSGTLSPAGAQDASCHAMPMDHASGDDTHDRADMAKSAVHSCPGCALAEPAGILGPEAIMRAIPTAPLLATSYHSSNAAPIPPPPRNT